MSLEPIAIVGQGCVLPSGLGADALWQSVRSAEVLISSVHENRWRLSAKNALCSPDSPIAEHSWSDQGGYVPSSLYPEDDILDPVFIWTLQAAQQALSSVHIENPKRAGLVMGNLSFPTAKMNQYTESIRGFSSQMDIDVRNRFMSGLPARWTAQELGIEGPAYALDSACASALYAIEQACALLRDHSCDLMLAGAVNAADDLFLHVGFSALKALSKSGQSRPFHAHADGLIPAEGAGMVALKRLRDAQRDSDSILGVIRAVGLSNDGRDRGLLVPSQRGQVAAMKQAYMQANIDPESVGWVECHATGTPVGDGTELKSMSEIFSHRLPISSLKANMGHLITASGIAGLIKVLGAFAHETMPPSPVIEEPHSLLSQLPFWIPSSEQQWTKKQRAGISAFGFGGNNAHLIVDRYRESSFLPAPHVAQTIEPREEIVVVGMDVRLGALENVHDFMTFLGNKNPFSPHIDSIPISIRGLRFPPNDIKQGIAQQNLLFSLVQKLTIAHEIPENTGVWIGMGTDLSVTRYGLRWRSRDRGEMDSSRMDAMIPELQAQGVLGCMPNVVSNRLNAQWGWTGPSGTISAEECSGIQALHVAISSLQRGRVDAALVGAVDLSSDSLHRESHLNSDVTPADGAVVWLLKRKSDVRTDERILATCTDIEQPLWNNHLRVLPHAASGLFECTAALLESAGKERGVTIRYSDMTDHVLSVHLLSATEPLKFLHSTLPSPVLDMPAHLPPIPNPKYAPDLPTDVALEELQRQRSLSRSKSKAVVENRSEEKHVFTAPISQSVPEEFAPKTQDKEILDDLEVMPTGSVASLFQQQFMELTAIHQAHMDQQVQIHNAFLAQRAAFDSLLAREGALEGEPEGSEEGAVHSYIHEEIQPEASPFAAQSSAPPKTEEIEKEVTHIHTKNDDESVLQNIPVLGAQSASSLVQPSDSAVKTHEVAPFAPNPIGITLSRADLEIHSQGMISKIYGPKFDAQDEYLVQTRMPEAPLLLADRVTGIDAEPASMSTGTLWSETDVCADSWYLHQNRMPAGIMIESGQADLMLISYLGIDLLCKGERSYRLLGCELMYHDDLPEVGDTLCYDIHVDGHAKHGDVRLFFFHYDCRVDGKPRLTVRDGQAGFFTEKELADSAGIIWTPEEQEIDVHARVDPPLVPLEERVFLASEVDAFAQGRPWECFGPSHMKTRTHTRTPRIQSHDMLFLCGDVLLQPKGGPWKRGYLRLEVSISPDDWFFEGHFKNDPCMPGTLMFEGCLQAMAFYLSAMGCTIDRDGWRFQPMRKRPYPLHCRGQVTPESKVLMYEIFVEEVVTGPVPHLVADLLCTVDGLGAFHARAMGLELVPDFPMNTMPELLLEVDDRPCATDKEGFPFDRRAMIASALGKPSEAFGSMYTPFDGHKRVARLPGPPYHFMSRVSAVRGDLGTCAVGTEIELEYDIPKDAWYFESNGHRVMPFAVFLEAALQPCGWLASAVGSALTIDEELFFRNLDGDGVLHDVLYPEDERLTTIVQITGISQSGGMIIESFSVRCQVADRCLYTLETVFGFFPAKALSNQIGLPTTPEHRAQLEPHSYLLNLQERPEQYFSGSARLADPMLCMLDRITAFVPDAELPFLRGEKDVDPGEWFFKAHFFQDPVQPGSLGIEAMIQLLQFYMLHTNMDADIHTPIFEPLAVQRQHKWKYRGQVVPENKLISTTMHIVEEGSDERGVYAIANASLWVDGKRIYEVERLGMRLVERDILQS